MTIIWSDDRAGVDWQELEALYRAAPLGNKNADDLEVVFGSNRALLGGDGLHPTEAGYDRMASAFLTAIERAFPIRGSFQ